MDAITYDAAGVRATITLDDGKVNALSSARIAEILAALEWVRDDADARVVVIAGRPGRFSAGFDLNELRSGGGAAELLRGGARLLHAVYGMPKPVVAACTGHALAMGALLLLACDVRVGADGPFKLGLNEVRIGMALPTWARTMARERLSAREYQRATALAHVYAPREAVAAGFLDEAVEPDGLAASVDAAVEDLAALDLQAYAAMVAADRSEALDTISASGGA